LWTCAALMTSGLAAQPGNAGAVVVDDGVAGRAQDAGAGDGAVAESLDGQEP